MSAWNANYQNPSVPCQTVPYIRIYRPLNSPASWLYQFTNNIIKSKNISDDLAITVDFNLDLSSPNNKWINVIQPLGLLQLITQPIRIQQTSQTIIDHIYVSKPGNDCKPTVSNIGISGHCMTQITRKLGYQNSLPKSRHKITTYDWCHFSVDAFQGEIKHVQWDNIYHAHSVESMLEVLNAKLQTIISNHLVTKTRYVKSVTLPTWFDNEVRSNIKRRNFLKRSKRWE